MTTPECAAGEGCNYPCCYCYHNHLIKLCILPLSVYAVPSHTPPAIPPAPWYSAYSFDYVHSYCKLHCPHCRWCTTDAHHWRLILQTRLITIIIIIIINLKPPTPKIRTKWVLLQPPTPKIKAVCVRKKFFRGFTVMDWLTVLTWFYRRKRLPPPRKKRRRKKQRIKLVQILAQSGVC